jgi:transposase
MNQLQAVALNEGIRRKKGLWREAGRKQLQSVAPAPWASQRRHDLLELLDRLSPRIAELSERVEEEARKSPVAQRLYRLIEAYFVTSTTSDSVRTALTISPGFS